MISCWLSKQQISTGSTFKETHDQVLALMQDEFRYPSPQFPERKFNIFSWGVRICAPPPSKLLILDNYCFSKSDKVLFPAFLFQRKPDFSVWKLRAFHLETGIITDWAGACSGKHTQFPSQLWHSPRCILAQGPLQPSALLMHTRRTFCQKFPF